MSTRLFKERICAVIASPTPQGMLHQIEQARQLTNTLELRFDWLPLWEQCDELLMWLASQKKHPVLIATMRREISGGRFKGRFGEEVTTLTLAGDLGCRWRDVAWETAKRFRPAKMLKAWLGRKRTIVSHHDFAKTPPNLKALADKLIRAGGDAVKIAAQCNSYADGMRLLSLCKGRKNVIVVPMGEIGLPLRVLALRAGSTLAYASVGVKTAPGQLTLDEMKNLYRADKLNQKSRVYGVIGSPITHTLSPLMHNRAFQEKKINAVYVPFLVAPSDAGLKDFLRVVRPLGIAGFSVTLPHKERILRYLDECDPLATRIGAVNTVVVRKGGKLFGCNTDYVGVLRALERKMPLRGSRVLICGAGGAARAAAFALAEAGSVVCICARRPKRAASLARAVGGEAVVRARLRKEFFDAIVNATPVGMSPNEDESPLRAEELNCRLVFDTIYRPLKTKLLQIAETRGIETVGGLEMFVAQGVAQNEIWMEQRAPVALMRRTVLEALQKEE
jgi:3-dehydroquinate dehydratase/shikimate dehydrogenase